MAATRLNALDQALDIAGSLFQSSSMTLADEIAGLGMPTGNSGTGVTVATINANDVTLTGVAGMTAQSVGHFLQVAGSTSSGNNGAFLIDTFISANSVTVVNPNAVVEVDTGATWTERNPYSLQDDLNYERTDRAAIKGVAYDAAIPTYQRPTAIGTDVPANLANIATKTTDAVAYVVNRAIFGQSVAATNTLITITSAGNLKHADAVDETGVPCFDAAPFTGDHTSCYVHITDGYLTGSELTVLTAGPHFGERIFGMTYNGASTSPNSVEIHFFSAPFSANQAVTNTPYVWEAGQVTTINCLYAFNERLDQLDPNAFRTVPALGILTDAQLSGDINNILSQIGSTAPDTSLNGLLTNITNYYPFSGLNATPTVVSALNILNQQIGNDTFTGPYLTDGYTVTQSLQALSNAITGTTVTRTIERVASAITANTAHTLPGGITYTPDGSFNGNSMFVFTRGLLRDPGPASGSNDYAETSSTSVTFYSTIKAGDHINYLVK